MACSTKKALIDIARDNPSFVIEKISSPEEKKAIDFFINQKNFLTLLFEQSHDPYYGTPRWSDECLLENQIGEIKTTDEGIFMHSVLYLNKKNEAGFCSNSSLVEKRHLVIYYCNRAREFIKIIYPELFEQKEDYVLCPSR